jgi:hypothetical protein
MEENVLSREQIALQVLCGVLGSMSESDGSEGALRQLKDGFHSAVENRQALCRLAFQMADIFIQERDRA